MIERTTKILITLIFSLQNIFIFSANGLYTRCNDKYCLYSDEASSPSTSECSQNNMNGWLLEIYDENVDQLVRELVNQFKSNLGTSYILLNTKRGRNSWTWSDKTTSTVSIQNQVTADRNVAFLSKSTSNNEPLLEYGADTSTSTANWAFVCQNKDPLMCTEDKKWSFNSSCYFVIWSSYLTWFEAQNQCIKQNENLAVFGNLDLKNFNKTWVQSLLDGNYWVGMSRYSYYWMKTDTYIGFSKWKPGYPSSDPSSCTAVDTSDSNNAWLNVPCAGNFVLLCMTDNLNFATYVSFQSTAPSTLTPPTLPSFLTDNVSPTTHVTLQSTAPSTSNSLLPPTSASSPPTQSPDSTLGANHTDEWKSTSSSSNLIAPLVVGWVVAAVVSMVLIVVVVLLVKSNRHRKSLNQNVDNSREMQKNPTTEPDNTYISINTTTTPSTTNNNEDYQPLQKTTTELPLN